MAEREFTSPVPSAAEVPFRMIKATRRWERIALKWRALAEQRCVHLVDLYQSGRWKHYYTEEEFLAELRQAVAIAERWAKIAPLPEEREAAARPSERSSGRRPPELFVPSHAGAPLCAAMTRTQMLDGRHGRKRFSEQQILDWLGGQRDAMLALLQTLVNTDSGSYDKAGVDAVGGISATSSATTASRPRSRPAKNSATPSRRPSVRLAAVRQPADPADGPPRHRVPEGRADPAAVQDRRRPRLWSGCRRHEIRPGA